MTMFKVRVNMIHVQSLAGNASRGAGLQVEYHEEHPEALVLILHDISNTHVVREIVASQGLPFF